MKTYNKVLCSLVLTGMLFSCDDFLEVKNYSGIPADEFVTSVENAQTALNGAYNGIYGSNALYRFGIYYYLDLATNEIAANGNDKELVELTDFSYYDGTVYVKNYWSELYVLLSRTNDACTKIYALRNSGDLSAKENEDLDRMIGECNFLRSFAYFYLTRSFGDKLPSHPEYDPTELGVPIVDTLIVSIDQLKIPRNTLGECWEMIVRGFETAYNRLPASWPSAKLGAATKGAAAGYLGQVYMYLKDYEKAKEWFEKALQAGNQTGGEYQLTENYAWNFDYLHENNSESIFEIQFQTTNSSAVLASYMWRRLGPAGKGFGMVRVSQEWVDKFSVGYQFTQETYNKLMPTTFNGATSIILRELLNVYLPLIGQLAYTREEFFQLYTGDWGVLGDQINEALRLAGIQRINVKTQFGWGTVDYSVMQTIIDASMSADLRMYDSFYVPGRDSIALDWAGTNVNPYTNTYYGFKKYVPYNAVENWNAQGLPGREGDNSINQRIFRLADLYLQYAEACYQTGGTDNAKKYLNKVRRRAWKYPFDDASLATPLPIDFPSSGDSGDFMEALIAERERELCLEGHLWFDYLRLNMAEELFRNRSFDPKIHHRFPIPLLERQIVGLDVLIQNSGY